MGGEYEGLHRGQGSRVLSRPFAGDHSLGLRDTGRCIPLHRLRRTEPVAKSTSDEKAGIR